MEINELELYKRQNNYVFNTYQMNIVLSRHEKILTRRRKDNYLDTGIYVFINNYASNILSK